MLSWEKMRFREKMTMYRSNHSFVLSPPVDFFFSFKSNTNIHTEYTWKYRDIEQRVKDDGEWEGGEPRHSWYDLQTGHATQTIKNNNSIQHLSVQNHASHRTAGAWTFVVVGWFQLFDRAQVTSTSNGGVQVITVCWLTQVNRTSLVLIKWMSSRAWRKLSKESTSSRSSSFLIHRCSSCRVR